MLLETKKHDAKFLHCPCKPQLVNIFDSEEPAVHLAAITVTKTTTPDNHCIVNKHISTT